MLSLKIPCCAVLTLLVMWVDNMPTWGDEVRGMMQALWCSVRLLLTSWRYVRRRIICIWTLVDCFWTTVDCRKLKLQKAKLQIRGDYSIPLRTESRVSRRYLHTHVRSHVIHTTECSVEAPKCPLTDERITKIQYIHTMKYYSVLKRKDILTHATAWMDPEDTALSDISQPQKG